VSDSHVSGDVTRLLQKMVAGDAGAAEAVAPLIYGDLRRVAANYLRKERIGHTLQPTALVHEAYLRMVRMDRVTWESRSHFIAVAANMMRNILTDYARRRKARPEGHADGDGDAVSHMGREQAEELIALDDALNQLADLDPRQARIVELRFYGGLSVEEIARLMNLSDRTIKREWAAAKVWLHERMTGKMS
jgi:RNA polymerase sigma factor (TIGR02999 family)